MASSRGILNIQSLNELTSEKYPAASGLRPPLNIPQVYETETVDICEKLGVS
jgi:hypothetical protein